MSASTLFRHLPALRKVGPYVAIELLLPGGTLLALLLWLSQGAARGAFARRHVSLDVPPAVSRVVPDHVGAPCPQGLECA